MTRVILALGLAALMAACTPPEAPEPEMSEPEPVPLSVPLATG